MRLNRGIETSMYIYAISNQKGGVGKTTTAVNLAYGLARRGHNTLLLDLDPQANASYTVLGPQEPGPTIYHVLIGNEPIDKVVRPSGLDHLDVLPADIDLAGAEVDLISEIGGQTRLRSALGQLSQVYEYIIIDTPPSLGLLTINALAAADQVIVPVSVSLFAMKGLAQLQETIERIRSRLDRPQLSIKGILPTMMDRTKVSNEVMRTMREHFPDQVFEASIPKNVKVEEVHGRQQPLYAYAPESKGAKAHERFVEEVIAHG